ncbi:MAG: hypothetical protein J6V72_20640 [Kiritimatiellae bacterium]|nr:hypothetical protein [Kiritimatiellia bacterium]
MKINYTARGFRFATFEDCYGEPCSIQESCTVLPRLWLGTDETRMHLSQKMVKDLLPLLTHFAEHGVLPGRKVTKRVLAKQEGK